MDFPKETEELMNQLGCCENTDVSTQRLLTSVIELRKIRWGRSNDNNGIPCSLTHTTYAWSNKIVYKNIFFFHFWNSQKNYRVNYFICPIYSIILGLTKTNVYEIHGKCITNKIGCQQENDAIRAKLTLKCMHCDKSEIDAIIFFVKTICIFSQIKTKKFAKRRVPFK